MCDLNADEKIEKLGPELSRIYFDAKADLARAQDSQSETFEYAARVVRAFWKNFLPG